MSDAPDFTLRTGQEKDTSIPRFYVEAQRNNRRSEEDGVPRYDDVEMVEILIPGDRNSVAVKMVNDEIRRRWPQHYAAFKANEEGGTDGTPLKELPGMTRSQIEELNYMHVYSIEALANLSDEQASKAVTMGGRGLRDTATRWLSDAGVIAQTEKLAAENRAKDARIEALEAQMADLIKRIPAGEGAQPQTET